jgi:hypothetical protein
METILGYYHEALGLEAAPQRPPLIALPGDGTPLPEDLPKTGT